MNQSNRLRRITALLLAAVLLLSSCGTKAAATTMHLTKTEGTVGVSDGAGKNVEPKENLGLYSGYEVGTQSESYAWINLDDVKLTKLDQDSEIEIQKEDRHLEIVVNSGALFFNVTEPLEEDESMEIRTSSMVVGIRGTCGWVEVPDGEHMNVYLLEGKVECSNGVETATVSAGEMAEMSETQKEPIVVRPFHASDVPAFIMNEMADSQHLIEQLPEEEDGESDFPIDDATVVLTMPVTAQDVKAAFAQAGIDKVCLKKGPGDDLQFLVVDIDLQATGKTLMSDGVGLLFLPGSSAGNLMVHGHGVRRLGETSYFLYDDGSFRYGTGGLQIFLKKATVGDIESNVSVWVSESVTGNIVSTGISGIVMSGSTVGDIVINNGRYEISNSTTGTISGNGTGNIW